SFRVWVGGVPVSGDLTRCATAPCDDPSAHFITAVVALPSEGNATQYYVGTSDGLLWNSEDNGQTWLQSSSEMPARPVTAIFADARDPLTAVAAAGGSDGARVFRTGNGGRIWEDMTGNLPAGEIRAVTGSLEGGAIYLAGASGLFYSGDALRNPIAATT